MSSWRRPASASESSNTWRSSTTPKRSRMAGSKKAPIPVSNSTFLPSRPVARRQRQASGMRFSASGATQRDHMARGALPNIAPPSSRCELPMSDQSFMATTLLHLAKPERTARIAGGVELVRPMVPGHHVHESPGRTVPQHVAHVRQRLGRRVVEDTGFDIDAVGQVLVVVALLGCDLRSTLAVDEGEYAFEYLRDDGRATGRTDHSRAIGAKDEAGRHGRQHALARFRRIGQGAPQAEGIRLAGDKGEVVHLVVEYHAGALGDEGRAELQVHRKGRGDHVAVG